MFRGNKAFSVLRTTLRKPFPHQTSKLLVNASVYNGTKNSVEIRQPFRKTSINLVNLRKKRKSDANKYKRRPTAQKCSNHKADRLGGLQVPFKFVVVTLALCVRPMRLITCVSHSNSKHATVSHDYNEQR